jgi:hypothetical protein
MKSCMLSPVVIPGLERFAAGLGRSQDANEENMWAATNLYLTLRFNSPATTVRLQFGVKCMRLKKALQRIVVPKWVD